MAAPEPQQGAPIAIKGDPEEEEAAAALAAVRSPGSRSANPSAGVSDSKDEAISDGSEELDDQPQGRMSGSQSHTTLPTEHGQQQGQLQPGGYGPPQQLQQLQQLAMLAQPGGSSLFASPQSEAQAQAQRGRRNARQQEQNKQVGGRLRWAWSRMLPSDRPSVAGPSSSGMENRVLDPCDRLGQLHACLPSCMPHEALGLFLIRLDELCRTACLPPSHGLLAPCPPPLQAQQRYRAKRKAQFEEMQRKVQVLSVENADLQVGATEAGGVGKACVYGAALWPALLQHTSPPTPLPSWLTPLPCCPAIAAARAGGERAATC